MANARTSLKRRGGSMRAHDALPPELRRWLQDAALPWSARSALKIWDRARRAGEDGCARLERAEARMLARDAARVWGPGHPAALT